MVVGQVAASPHQLRPLLAVLDELPPLPDDWLALTRFAARYYHYPLGQTLFTALPTALRNPPRRAGHAARCALSRASPPGNRRRGPRQLALWARLRQGRWRWMTGARAASAKPASCCAMAGRRLAGAGDASAGSHDGEPRPGADRRTARGGGWAELGGVFRHLLDGITGSSKTEVYLQWIAQALAAGRQALVLVPEINLTRSWARFRARFPHTPTVCLHSNLADGARAQAWLAAWEGRARLVIGTRWRCSPAA